MKKFWSQISVGILAAVFCVPALSQTTWFVENYIAHLAQESGRALVWEAGSEYAETMLVAPSDRVDLNNALIGVKRSLDRMHADPLYFCVFTNVILVRKMPDCDVIPAGHPLGLKDEDSFRQTRVPERNHVQPASAGHLL